MKDKNGRMQIQEILPIGVRPEKVPTQVKKLIYDLEKEYIKRYNVLIGNREIYQNTIQNLSTELDKVAVTPQILSNFVAKLNTNDHYQQKTQPQ